MYVYQSQYTLIQPFFFSFAQSFLFRFEYHVQIGWCQSFYRLYHSNIYSCTNLFTFIRIEPFYCLTILLSMVFWWNTIHVYLYNIQILCSWYGCCVYVTRKTCNFKSTEAIHRRTNGNRESREEIKKVGNLISTNKAK